MMDSIVAQECMVLCASLRHAATQTDSPTTLHHIARAFDAVAAGALLYAAGAVTPVCRNTYGLIIAAHIVDDGAVAHVVTGVKSTKTPWTCSCTPSAWAWGGVCSHMVAVKVLIAVELADARAIERAERQQLVGRRRLELDATRTQLEYAQTALREAQSAYDAAEVSYLALLDHLNQDEAEAAAEQTTSALIQMPAGARQKEAA